jgi:hypothetical protein
VELVEVTVTAQSGYPDTAVAKRSKPIEQGYAHFHIHRDPNFLWLELA